MIKFKIDQGHDLHLLLRNMIAFVSTNNLVLIQYSTCKEGLIFYLSYLYKD